MVRRSAFWVATFAAAICLLVAPLAFGAGGSLQATFTVVSSDPTVYPTRVVACSLCLYPERALAEPDGEGALLWHNGEVVLGFERVVNDCRRVEAWVKGTGWGPGRLRVYVSEDGRRWRLAGNAELPAEMGRLAFEGGFGAVRYLKVVRNGWIFGALVLDALGAVGGDR